MITAKLAHYKKDEVNTLAELITSTSCAFLSTYCEKTDDNSTCESCPNKTICYDLLQFQDFLEREISYGYPHIKKTPSL